MVGGGRQFAGLSSAGPATDRASTDQARTVPAAIDQAQTVQAATDREASVLVVVGQVAVAQAGVAVAPRNDLI